MAHRTRGGDPVSWGFAALTLGIIGLLLYYTFNARWDCYERKGVPVTASLMNTICLAPDAVR